MNKKTIKRKNFNEYISIKDEHVLDTKKADIELIADDEVFVIVNNTNNYWISNYGRLVNNLRGSFYLHNNHKEKINRNRCTHYTLSAYTSKGELYKIDTYTDKLVAEHFLDKNVGCNTIWHIDRDKSNCFYKNLVWVTTKEYYALCRGIMSIEDLDRQQGYVPYITLKYNKAYRIWSGIYKRCYCMDDVYEGASMCDLWKYDRDAFVEWWNSEYYEIAGESMAVDKDLLFPGNKEYCPEKCCIIPQTLNTMLSNCKKHRASKGKKVKMNLPLGVRYDSMRKMYYGAFRPYGHDETVALEYWNTAEEAFLDYKRHKQADILIMADKYKNKIPKKVYNALLKIEVKPY